MEKFQGGKMAKPKAKGSIILKALIVILGVALIATILYPKKIWEEEEENVKKCRANMDRIFKAEMIFLQYNNIYTDSLDQLISFYKDDTTKEYLRKYFIADTAFAETMIEFLTQRDSAADRVIRNLLADTLMFAIIESINYDSNLAHVMLNRLEAENLVDAIKQKRATGSDDVTILKELDKEYKGIQIYEPIKDDDSLKLVFNRMIPEVTIGSLLDTLYSLNENWAQKIDSAVFYTLDDLKFCPTINREYKIAVIDTSVIKYVNIECPLDSMDVEATKANFVEYHLGHRRIENHGKIETGEKSWNR
jgi:hypothetical protein